MTKLAKRFIGFFFYGTLMGMANAATIASTTFDGRTASGNTASGLNWTTAGVADPGTMSSSVFAGGAVNLFNGQTLTQNSFVPALNTGNGNTSWVTTVSLTAIVGNTVTITDVTFDYLAVSGGEVLNVARRSDFTVALLSPSSVELATASIADVTSGTTANPQIAPVTLTLSTSVTLSLPGTYTLVLRGGDFLGVDETGNHTGIDNLSINGTVIAVPEPSSILLSGLAVLGFVISRRRR